jgi:hypothetical protein
MDVPAATPVTIPDKEPIVAIVVCWLDQTPPVIELVSVVEDPTQIVLTPVIGPGVEVMVTEVVI